MTKQMRTMEGRRVDVALRDGTRIDDCQLVSGNRPGTATVWLFWNARDVFVPAHEVVDLREACHRPLISSSVIR